MKTRLLLLSVAVGASLLTGCATKTVTSGAGGTSSRPVAAGLKSPNQVAPCCRDFAAGKISLDRCMEKPECIANNRTCCMNAF